MYHGGGKKETLGKMETGIQDCLRCQWYSRPSGERLQNLMLSYGDMERQDIFYNIPGADVKEVVDVDPFKMGMAKLYAYFAPQHHETHERYLFHEMAPEAKESLEKFVMPAQIQARKCNFGRSAVVDKMMQLALKELRERILQENNLTLELVLRVKKIDTYQTAIKCKRTDGSNR